MYSSPMLCPKLRSRTPLACSTARIMCAFRCDTRWQRMGRRIPSSISCGLTANGTGYLRKPQTFRNRLQRAAWSNSSPSITGAIRLNDPALRWNITSRMIPGRFGRRRTPDLKAKSALSMGKTSAQFFSGTPTAHLWRMDRPLPCSTAIDCKPSSHILGFTMLACES